MRITGRWRITEAELWDRDALDLVAPAFIEFTEDGSGSFGFIAVQGEMDCREMERDGMDCRVWSSPGRATTSAIRPAAAAGLCSRRTAHCAGVSSSTLATTQASWRPVRKTKVTSPGLSRI